MVNPSDSPARNDGLRRQLGMTDFRISLFQHFFFTSASLCFMVSKVRHTELTNDVRTSCWTGVGFSTPPRTCFGVYFSISLFQHPMVSASLYFSVYFSISFSVFPCFRGLVDNNLGCRTI